MDLTNEVSMSPRRPSDVPEDCIMRCIVLRRCLRIDERGMGRLPVIVKLGVKLAYQDGIDSLLISWVL